MCYNNIGHVARLGGLLTVDVMHSGQKSRTCTIRQTKESSVMAGTEPGRHISTHSDEKPGKQPEQCDGHSENSGQEHFGLIQNVAAVHSGPKPFSCQLCRKSFLYKTALCVHFCKVSDVDRRILVGKSKGTFVGVVVVKGALKDRHLLSII